MTRTRLDLAPDPTGRIFSGRFETAPDVEHRLHLGGVATAYVVRVDGREVAQSQSMFERLSIGLADLPPGEHELQIQCRDLDDVLAAMPRRPRARWRSTLTPEHRMRWLRSSLIGHCPGMPTGPAYTGPWRPVVLEALDALRVEDFSVRTDVEDGVGILSAEFEVAGAERVRLVLEGPNGAEAVDVPLQRGRGPHRHGAVVIEVPRVERWWPHTHGEPVLYDVRVEHAGRPLPLPGDATAGVEQLAQRVGFRTLGNGSDGRPDVRRHSLDLRVNGAPVFARGAVWTPQPDDDLAALDRAVELGLNLVRVPGWATYESDAFWQRCDELGLMVWQDLMFANFDYPLADDAFAALVRTEVATETARLRRHPAAVVICGSSEVEQQAAMFGVPPEGEAAELAEYLAPVVAEQDVDAIWVPSTPIGGDLPFRVGEGIAHYYGVGAYRRPLDDARRSGVRFAAECLAFANEPDEAVDAETRTAGTPRDPGADWDFADISEHYRCTTGLSTGEVMATTFGEWRRAGSACHGGIVHWLRDFLPGPGWGLLDHRGRPKPCARELAPVLAPVAIWLTDEGLDGVDVHLAVDEAESLDGSLRVALLRDDGSVVLRGDRPLTVPGRSVVRIGVEEVLGRFADAAYAYRFGPPAHDVVEAVWTTSDGVERTARWRRKAGGAG